MEDRATSETARIEELLEEALEATENEMAQYHIRHALQHLQPEPE